MRIFCDLHHAALGLAMRKMAERLGGEIYFPVGMEWWTNGFWDINRPYNNSPDTAKQYLSLDQAYKPVDGTVPLNQIKDIKPSHYEIKDLAHGDIMKSITFEQFTQMGVDVIIASIPDHARTYKRLRDIYKPQAKLVFQMGNHFIEAFDLVKEGFITNLLASTAPFDIPCHRVFYHQWMTLRDFKEPPMQAKIKSFVHLLPQPEIYNSYKKALPEIVFKAYGAGCPDGYCNSLNYVHNSMQDSSMGIHWKPGSDGFGHVIHSWMMLGRPVIVNYEEYKNKLAGQLLIPDQTCISLDSGDGFGIIRDKIRNILNNRDRHIEMCKKTFNRFYEVVNYEREAKEIGVFFDNLV